MLNLAEKLSTKSPELIYWQIYKGIHEDPAYIKSNAEKIKSLTPAIWDWIAKDVFKRGNIFYHLVNELNTDILRLIPKSNLLSLMLYLIYCDDVDCLKKAFDIFRQHLDQSTIDYLFQSALNKRQIEIICCFVELENLNTNDFEKVKLLSEIVSFHGNPAILNIFLKKIFNFPHNKKKILLMEHIHPFWKDLSHINHGSPLAKAFDELGVLYQEADQNYHLSSIIKLAKRLTYRFKKREFIMNWNELEELGKWRQRLSLCNRGSRTIHNAPKFGVIREEINSCTVSEGAYNFLEDNIKKINLEKDKDYIRVDSNDDGDYKATIYYLIQDSEIKGKLSFHLNKNVNELKAEDCTILLTKIYKNVTSKSFVVHSDPKHFKKILFMLNCEIENALSFQCNIKDETSILEFTELIGRIQWWWTQATFYKRGSETIGDAIIRALFFSKNLYIEGYTNYPYIPVLTTPNITDYQKRYINLLKNVPRVIPHTAPKEFNLTECDNITTISHTNPNCSF